MAKMSIAFYGYFNLPGLAAFDSHSKHEPERVLGSGSIFT